MKILMDVTPLRDDGSCGGSVNLCRGLIDGFLAAPGVSLILYCNAENRAYLEQLYADRVAYCEMAGDGTMRTSIPVLVKSKFWLKRILPAAWVTALKRLLPDQPEHEANTYSESVELDADVVFYPFSSPAVKLFGVPSAATILDIQHEYFPDFFSPEELSRRRRSYREIVQDVDAAVCISDYTKETFCEKYGYPAENAYTVYIAIQNRFSGAPDLRLLEKFGVTEGRYIFYPANFWPHKNHEALIRAFAVYAGENRDAKLVLSGNALDKKEHFESLLAQLDLSDRVILAGYVSEEELYALYAGSCGVIYPSLFEGFGIPVVEAMHIDKLVACSNLTSLPEVGRDAIHYFDPTREEDMIAAIRFLFTEKMTPAIHARYQERLKTFANDEMIRGYLDVFEKMIDQKRQSVENIASLKLSIITVCFNEGENIRYTLDSVLAQNTTQFELIVRDGGSQDDTFQIVQSYADAFREKGIDFLIDSRRDGGIYFGMNNGIDAASGDYCLFLNGGDGLHDPEALGRVLHALAANPNADVLYADCVHFDDNGERVVCCTHENLSRQDDICHQAAFIRTSLLKERPYDTSYRLAGDYEYWFYLREKNRRFVHFKDVVSNFREGGSSFSRMEISLQESERIQEKYMAVNEQEIIPYAHRLSYRYESGRDDWKNLGQGWSSQEKDAIWACGNVSYFYICPEAVEAAYDIEIDILFAIGYANTLYVNGVRIGDIPAICTPHTYRAAVPADALHAGINRFVIRAEDEVLRYHDKNPNSPDMRQLNLFVGGIRLIETQNNNEAQ